MTSKNAVRAALLAALAVSGAAACSGSDGVASPGEGVFIPSPPPAAPPPPPPAPPPPIFTIVEEMPTFPGGDQALLEYMAKNTKYPPLARENGLQGIVVVTFVVDERGRIKDAQVLRGIGGGCDEEAMRVVQSMPPWKPGKQRGMSVRVQYNLPFRFTLR